MMAAARRKTGVVVQMPMALPESKYARCRTIGHAWDPIAVTKPAFFGATIDLRCINCTTIRRDIVRPYDGKLLSRRYSYPEDYKAERVDRTKWRMAWMGTLSPRLVRIGSPDDEDAEE